MVSCVRSTFKKQKEVRRFVFSSTSTVSHLHRNSTFGRTGTIAASSTMFPTFPQRRTSNAKKRTKKTNRSDHHVVHLMGDPTRTASSSSSTTNHHPHKTGYDEDLSHDPPPYNHHRLPAPVPGRHPPSPSNLTILDDLGVQEENHYHHQLLPNSSDGSCTAGFIISDIAAGSYYSNNNQNHPPDHDPHVHDTKKDSKQPTSGGHHYDHDLAAGPIDHDLILKDLANVAADTKKKSKRRGEDGLVEVQCGCWPFHTAASRR